MIIPVAAQDPTVLVLSWTSKNAQDVEWAVFYDAADGVKDHPLLSWEKANTRTLRLNAPVPGAYRLHWKNSLGGWFGGDVCTISYEAKLYSKKEIDEVEKKKSAAELKALEE